MATHFKRNATNAIFPPLSPKKKPEGCKSSGPRHSLLPIIRYHTQYTCVNFSIYPPHPFSIPALTPNKLTRNEKPSPWYYLSDIFHHYITTAALSSIPYHHYVTTSFPSSTPPYLLSTTPPAPHRLYQICIVFFYRSNISYDDDFAMNGTPI
jgi:hypothetical protein